MLTVSTEQSGLDLEVRLGTTVGVKSTMSQCHRQKPSFLDESQDVLLIDPEDTLIVPGIDENAFI